MGNWEVLRCASIPLYILLHKACDAGFCFGLLQEMGNKFSFPVTAGEAKCLLIQIPQDAHPIIQCLSK